MADIIVGIDVGGTFTDFVVLEPGGARVHKLPSTPRDPSRAMLQGLRDLGLLVSPVDDITLVHGSTVATNALLERKGARTAFITTEGFEDLLEIARQTRPALYDLDQDRPEPLVPRELRFGSPERVDAAGTVLKALSLEQAEELARRVAESGVQAAAVCLLFSFLNPGHERLLAEALRRAAPGMFVSASHEVLPEYREYERASTTTVNAYVGPVMGDYLLRLEESLGSSAGDPLVLSLSKDERGSARPKLRVMQSSGGALSVRAAVEQPVRTVLSGPAGGVTGAVAVARRAGFSNVITLDMGGTSTDVALAPGRVQRATSAVLGGVAINVPMMDIHTVGAGGGSIARVDAGGALKVGPESAGAEPGPACYGVGDEVTVTDANLVLGRLLPEAFLGGRMTLDVERSSQALATLAQAMGTDARTAALGVVRVVNSNMERAVRAISLGRGFDPRVFTLLAFGGAGPQHACELAEALDIPRVLVPLYPGALSAYGCAIADVVREYSQTVMARAEEISPEALREAFVPLERQGLQGLLDDGLPRRSVTVLRQVDVRYVGQSYELTLDCPPPRQDVGARIARRFHAAHRQRFGYATPSAPVEVVNVRVTAVGKSWQMTPPLDDSSARPRRRAAAPVAERTIAFREGPLKATVYERKGLSGGARFAGPALVTQMDATTVVPPGWNARVDAFRNLVVERGA